MTDQRCPCCGAAEPDWNGSQADPRWLDRSAEIERLRERVAELQAQCGYTESIKTLEIERLRAIARDARDHVPWDVLKRIDAALCNGEQEGNKT